MNPAVVVIPCFNEAERFCSKVFLEFNATNPDIGFILVDDGSTDATWSALQRLECSAPSTFKAVRLPINVGKAEAVRTGIRLALDTNTTFVGFWDADLATPLSAIVGFRATLQENPELRGVIGARVKLLGRAIDRSAKRHYVGRIFATAVSLILGIRVYDSQCGAKLFRVSPALHRVFSHPFLSPWLFDVEILARLALDPDHLGRDVASLIHECPLQQWRDVRGSKLQVTDFLRSPLDLARIYYHYFHRGYTATGWSANPQQLVSEGHLPPTTVRMDSSRK